MTTQQRLDDLLRWPRGWNGYDAAAPNALSVAHAKAWITQFQQEHATNWQEPATTADAWGDVCMEWRHNDRLLSVFVGAQNIEYLTAWQGCEIEEMETGDANTSEEQEKLWTWLMEDKQS